MFVCPVCNHPMKWWRRGRQGFYWIPAFAGMTERGGERRPRTTPGNCLICPECGGRIHRLWELCSKVDKPDKKQSRNKGLRPFLRSWSGYEQLLVLLGVFYVLSTLLHNSLVFDLSHKPATMFCSQANSSESKRTEENGEPKQMVTIRLAMRGAKKRPFYLVVASDSRKRRDSGYIERLGYFNPRARKHEMRFELDRERFDYWLGQGAKPSERVTALLKSGVSVKVAEAAAPAEAAKTAETTATAESAASAETVKAAAPAETAAAAETAETAKAAEPAAPETAAPAKAAETTATAESAASAETVKAAAPAETAAAAETAETAKAAEPAAPESAAPAKAAETTATAETAAPAETAKTAETAAPAKPTEEAQATQASPSAPSETPSDPAAPKPS